MAALTIDVIVDRMRAVMVALGFTEAVSWASFDHQPTTNIDRVFRIPPPSSQWARGEFDYVEERTDSVQVWVARKHAHDYDAVRRALLQDIHTITSAVVRDALQDSGDYNVRDGGRGHAISEHRSQDYVTLRLTLPVEYEAQL